MEMAIPTTGESTDREGRPLGQLLVKFAVVVISLFAVASPIWVLIHGMGFLNQAPPPYWNTNAGHAAPGQSTSVGRSFGGC